MLQRRGEYCASPPSPPTFSCPFYKDYLDANAANGGEKAKHLRLTHYRKRKLYKR